ncbi:unnamed protein product [Acanthoscelides obtectus]|uniref:Uncharacterized protein n=1 Tax=Acanthoscelides obtectus TaxID=200917 RepID=A0A9P0KUL2_ACAOB|nr:unnamed protein product [Acanthoscelides obtectus]CAK1643445.1 hypothetical protein AOBTE_LOCUS13532 [Acanthoscelides obtectus]
MTVYSPSGYLEKPLHSTGNKTQSDGMKYYSYKTKY